MKIHGSGGASGIKEILQKLQQDSGATKDRQVESTPAAPRGEKVEISQEAREIQRLKALLEQIPDVREKKVEEVRQLIQEGRYQVDLNAVSDRILQALIVGDL
jgi:negative regulator of flagellin synthesis FlgM